MRRALLAALFSLSGCSGAEPADAAAGTGGWRVDKAKSRIEFVGKQTGETFKGAFREYEARIEFDPADLSNARIEVVIDTASAATGDRQRDAALPTSDWFSAKAFPSATFLATDIAGAGEGAYEARGTLTIRGVEKPLVLPFTLSIENDRAVADGSVTLVRSDLGVGQGDFATGEWVALDVAVNLHIEADR